MAFPAPTSAWSPDMDVAPEGLVYSNHGYLDEDAFDIDSLRVDGDQRLLLATSWVILAVPIEVGANVLVEATDASEEFVYTPVRVRIVRVARDATLVRRDDLRAGAEVTVAVPGGVAEGHYYEPIVSTFDKAALVDGGIFALEVTDHMDYPGLGDELLLSRAFELNATDMTSLQLGEGGQRSTPVRVSASVLEEAGIRLSASEFRRMSAGTHPEVQEALAEG